MSQIRVAVLSDNRLLRLGLEHMIALGSTFDVVPGGDSATFRGRLSDASLDVVVVDVAIDRALPLCAELHRKGVHPRLILLAPDADEEWGVKALESGARGILTKEAGSEDLLKAIQAVHEGGIWAQQQVLVRVVEKMAALSDVTHADHVSLARLSHREIEIVRHAASGLSNLEIADRLKITEATVKAHLGRIFQKLGLRDRSQLAAFYHRTLDSSAPHKDSVSLR